MKKMALFAVVVSAFCAFAAEDSYLYWMIGDEATYDGAALSGTYQTKIVAIAGIGADWSYQGADGNYLTMYEDMGGTALGNSIDFTVGQSLPYFASITTTGNWSYFVELYKDGSIYAHSESMPYDQQSIASMNSMSRPGTAWAAMAFVPAAVPEPNSGLLMLLGCAALALRRRRQKAKA